MTSFLSQMQFIAAKGLTATSATLKVTAQNMANARSTATTPGGLPYTPLAPVLKQAFDKRVGATYVKFSKTVNKPEPYVVEYNPNHPAADANGNVLMPNINPLLEITNLMEQNQNYKRILNVYKEATNMKHQTISLMK